MTKKISMAKERCGECKRRITLAQAILKCPACHKAHCDLHRGYSRHACDTLAIKALDAKKALEAEEARRSLQESLARGGRTTGGWKGGGSAY